MTDLERVAHDTTDPQQYTDLQPGLLDLFERKDPNLPATVFIRLFSGTEGTIPGFALQEHGTFFSGGLSWKSGTEFSLFVTFVFLNQDIREIECALPYSEPFGGPPVMQQLVITPVRDMVTFTFYVVIPSGRLDPRIVVTPINGVQDLGPVTGRA